MSRDGQVVPINDKPAELLTLFLSDTQSVHSKTEILDNVWAERVVTDQVVFQNINALRSLFGNDAIKTFSKKGYQWQLPVTVEVSERSEANADETGDTQTTQKAQYYKVTPLSLGLGGLVFFAAVVVALLTFYLPSGDSVPNGYVYLAKQANDSRVIQHALVHRIRTEEGERDHQALFDSPFETWKRLSGANQHQKVIAVKRYTTDLGEVMRFQIQGAKRGWHGYLFSETQEDNVQQLNVLLSNLAETDFFEQSSDYAALARLIPLYNANPDSLLLLHHMIELNFKLGNLDRAVAMTENQLTTLKDEFSIGLFHQLNAKVNTWNQNWQRGQQSSDIALQIFTRLNLHSLTAHAYIQDAWVQYFFQQHQQAKQSLNQAVIHARLAEEPLQEVTAHLIQAFLASKLKQQTVMQNQIDLAQQLIELHQLHAEHLVALNYYIAWGEEETKAKLRIYEAMLKMPFSELYSHFLYGAAEAVRDAYIAQGNIAQARSSIQPWQRPSFVALSEAHIAYASGDTTSAVALAIEAFNQAQIGQAREEALDAALLLIRYQQDGVSVANSATYLNYIRQNASHRWLNQNNATLKQLGVVLQVS